MGGTKICITYERRIFQPSFQYRSYLLGIKTRMAGFILDS